jgi:hypothetical protein
MHVNETSRIRKNAATRGQNKIGKERKLGAEDQEANLTPEQKAKHKQILKRLNALFSIDALESRAQGKTTSNLITECVLRPHPYKREIYIALMYVKRSIPGLSNCFEKMAMFYIPIHIDNTSALPTLMPYLDDINDEKTIPDALNDTAETIAKGWVPICKALAKKNNWRSDVHIQPILGKNGDTFDYDARMEITIEGSIYDYHSLRTFEIKSRTADRKISFTLKTDKDAAASTHDVKIPDELNTLLTKIEDHMKTRYTPWSAQYTTQINRITRLLDEAQNV